jgi:flagellar hook-length control protein FliK
MQQLADKMQSAIRQGTSEIRIQIQPESLGEVKLRIQVEAGVVSAHVQVANQEVQKIIEGNLQSLRDALSMQHLQMGSVDVNVRGDSRGNGDESANADGLPASSPVTGSAAADGSEAAGASMQALGLETGRRFGNNTVEFFA